MSVVIVTGALAPYTHVLYEALGAALDEPLYVLACTSREPARLWELPMAKGYNFEVLPGIRFHRGATRNFYFNPSVVSRLRTLMPRLAIVGDFSPTALLAVLAARSRGIPLGVRTDGVPSTDPGNRSRIRRMMRRAIIARSEFGIGPSLASLDLLHSYGLPRDRLVLSKLTAGWWPKGKARGFAERPYDILFCGTLNDSLKGAGFFAEVVNALAARRPGLTVRIAGDGPMRSELEARMAKAGVAARFDGFLQQGQLEEVYGSARLFMFPSRNDPWGVVVNEAMQCGTPVVASPHATAGSELLAPAGAGVVLPLQTPVWVDAALSILNEIPRWEAMHGRGLAAEGAAGLNASVEKYLEVVRRFGRAAEDSRTLPSRVGGRTIDL